MARKKKDNPQILIPTEDQPVSDSEPSPITETDTVSGLSSDPGPTKQTPQSKLVLPELETGGIDLESMRPKTIERLKQAIRLTPDLFSEAKAASAPVKIEGGAIDLIHTGICKLVGYGASFQFPKELCEQIFAMNEDELKVLREPSAEFIERHFGATLQKLGPDFKFYMAMAQVYISKFAMLVLLSRQTNAQQTAAPKAA